MRGKGVASTRSGYAGDLICRIVVETPVNLTSEQKELLQKLEESLQGKDLSKHAPKSSGFLDGVKNSLITWVSLTNKDNEKVRISRTFLYANNLF